MAIAKITNDHDKDHFSMVLGLHAFTGCDTTNSFVEIRKLKPLKIIYKYPEYKDTFMQLGEAELVPTSLDEHIEKCVHAAYMTSLLVHISTILGTI